MKIEKALNADDLIAAEALTDTDLEELQSKADDLADALTSGDADDTANALLDFAEWARGMAETAQGLAIAIIDSAERERNK